MMERIGQEVERTLGRTSGGESSLGRVVSAWPRAVGETVARNAWPLREGRDGTLHVATASSTWAFELDRLGPEIAARLEALLGEGAPKRFRFRPGPIPEPKRSLESAENVPKERLDVPPEVAAAAASAAAEIDDPELRELVARAARASLSAGGSGRRF